MADDAHSSASAPEPRASEALLAAALAGSANPKVDSLLERQIAIADLQIEDLKREDKLRHWSLVVRHISDVLKVTLELAIAAIAVAILVAIGAALWTAAHDNSLIIEAFSVPPDMAARGLTGQAVAAGLQDRLAAMQDATDSARPANSYANNWGDNITVEIPNTGVSISQFYRYLASWLGHQTHITGEVWKSGGSVAITARAGADGAATVSGKEADFPALLQKAAEGIYECTQPYRYAAYIENDGIFPHGGGGPRLARAKAILQRLSVEGPTASDRAWATVGLGVNQLYQADIPASVAYYRQAIAMMPDIALAWDDLDAAEAILEHEESSLTAARGSVRLLSGSGPVDMTARARAIILPDDRGTVAFYGGDYQTAVSEYTAASRLPDYSGMVEQARETASMSLALQHDGHAARAAWRNLPPAPDASTHDGRAAFKPQLDAALADWKAIESERDTAEAGLQDSFSRNEAATQLLPYFAVALAETGDIAGAEALIAKTPLDCDLCVRLRGHIAALKHDWAGAAHWFAMVSARTPDVPFADSDWGAMLLAKGDPDGAIAKFEAANQKGPHFADPLEMWGEALIAKRRSDLALAKFEEADKGAPNWGRLHLKWGEALLWSGRKDDARAQFAIAAHLDLTPAEKSELARMGTAHG